MQEQNTILPSFDNLFCSYSKSPAFYLCKNQNCQYQALTCFQKNCQCTKNHFKCVFIPHDQVIQKIYKKLHQNKKDLTQINKLFDSLTSIIQNLSNIRQSLEIYIKNYGLNQSQSFFKYNLQSGSHQFITGELVYFIRQIKNKQFDSQIIKWKQSTNQIINYEQKINEIFEPLNSYTQISQISLSMIKKKIILKQIGQRSIFIDAFHKIKNQKIEDLKEINLSKTFDQYTLDSITMNKFPSSLKYIKTLESIRLKKNNLTAIPNKQIFKQFKNLKQLKITNNQIVHIPYLGRLSNLQILNLEDNLIEIYEQFNLKNLKSLNLKNNKIQFINNLSKLPKLQTLNLQSNLIEVVQNIQNLKNLKFLQLGKNRIKRIISLDNKQKLVILNLFSNQINVNKNKLQKLNSYLQIQKCSHLRRLNLGYQIIEKQKIKEQLQEVINKLKNSQKVIQNSADKSKKPTIKPSFQNFCEVLLKQNE